jgi:cysteine desulfurase
MALQLPIYLDNHSTTKADPRVVEEMLPYLTERYGNAASKQHEFGWVAEGGAEHARKQIAALMDASPEEIVFTSGATESVNLAIRGVAESLAARGRHIVTAVTEHRAVLDTAKHLEDYGFTVTQIPVDRHGMVDPEDVKRALRQDTILVSIMAANNEIGTVAPLEQIGAICRERQILFHSDATQAVGKIRLSVQTLQVDLISFSAHKMHGPKGIGALYVRSMRPPVALAAQINGGGHERGLRSGTLNVPAIVGFGKSAEIASLEMATDVTRMMALRDRLVGGLTGRLDEVTLNGHPRDRLPNNASLTFAHARADRLIMELKEIAMSTGSACSSATPEPSHVLRAIGLSKEAVASTIRIGLSKFTTAEEIDFAVERVTQAVKKIRAGSMAVA